MPGLTGVLRRTTCQSWEPATKLGGGSRILVAGFTREGGGPAEWFLCLRCPVASVFGLHAACWALEPLSDGLWEAHPPGARSHSLSPSCAPRHPEQQTEPRLVSVAPC